MRIWSLHPQYLDARGLVALWRESLLAQAVLKGQTKGYTRHPQLQRFQEQTSPAGFIAAYLRGIHIEAESRGYNFDAAKIGRSRATGSLTVTRGQLDFEWSHLLKKVKERDPEWYALIKTVKKPRAHPLFRVVRGHIASWEKARVKNKKISHKGTKAQRK
jgi:hypothetical protein